MAGGQALQDFLPNRLFSNTIQELLDDFEVHVGLEQGEADFLQRLGNVVLCKDTLPSKLLEDPFKLFA